MSPGEMAKNAFSYGKHRFDDAPVLTIIKLAFYVSLILMSLTTRWTLSKMGHIIMTYEDTEKKLNRLEEAELPARVKKIEQDQEEYKKEKIIERVNKLEWQTERK